MPHRIRSTVVGSFPIPSWLEGNTSLIALRDAVAVVLKIQELAGLDLISDGELKRFDPGHPETNGMIDYFVSQMGGIRTRFSREDLQSFRVRDDLRYRGRPAGVVAEKLSEGTLNLPDDFAFARALTTLPLKFTCTGPHMLSKVLVDCHYADHAALALDIADVLRRQLETIDADVVQLDEANISGHPEDRAWAVEAMNHVLDGIRAEKAVHICFGNYGGQTVQQGFWKNLLPLMNALRVDHLVLEFARRGYGELDVLNELDSRIGLGIGVVDIKDNEVESPDLIASRIEHICETLGENRLKYIHPDCGLWMLQRGVAEKKIRALVEGRNLFEGGRNAS